MRNALLAGAFVAAACAGPAFGQGQSAAEQLGSVQACRTIADLAQRVACYDRASAPGAAPAPIAPVPPPPTPEEQFGRSAERARPAPPPPPPEARAAASSPELDQLSARIVALRSDALGRLSFVLDNGQVWRMTESEGVFDFPSRGDTVTIRRGAIGGYRLDWGSNVGVRVARQD